MRTRFFVLCFLLCQVLGSQTWAEQKIVAAAAVQMPERYRRVLVDDCKTSITLGSISMELKPFVYSEGCYTSPYVAKLFPLFFMSERGQLQISLSPEQLSHLLKGERVEFTGRAMKNADAFYQVTGLATPGSAEHPESGRIKVRVHVSKRIELIFNTQYHFPKTES